MEAQAVVASRLKEVDTNWRCQDIEKQDPLILFVLIGTTQGLESLEDKSRS